MVTAEGNNEQKAECPAGAKLVGGSCFAPGVGDDGGKLKGTETTGCKLQPFVSKRVHSARLF